MVRTSFNTLPEHLQMEILSRFPLKSLVRCICVSKRWASMIRTKEFRDLYLERSMARPRVLFFNYPLGLNPTQQEVMLFHSVNQDEEKPFLLSPSQQQTLLSPFPQCDYISQPIRGLICLRKHTTVVICNPGTKTSQNLPEIQLPKRAVISTFFGYDEVTDEFKVLCLIVGKGPRVATIYQVFTVGSSEKSWRQITCKHAHSPFTDEGLCKGGLLYYGARWSDNKSFLMSFNVRSEEFCDIELPKEVNINHFWKLVNNNGDIALVDDDDTKYGVENDLNGSKVFHMWVRNEVTGKWRSDRIEISSWKETVDDIIGSRFKGMIGFRLKGIIGKKQLVFAQDFVLFESLFVLCYDRVNLRRFEIEGLVKGVNVQTFLGHVDSTWLI